jgi:hypothetical protein
MMNRPAKSKRPAKQEIAASRSLVAPTKGWNARDPEAAMAPGWAIYLDNWWPTPSNVQLRKGALDHMTGLSTTPIKSLLAWHGRSGSPKNRLFACADTGIYDATVAGTFGAVSTPCTDGRWVGKNFATTGTSVLFAVNGVNDARYYDGATWTITASYAITGGGTLNSNTMSNVEVFKRALFFTVNGTLDFYYWPVDTIAGTITRFPLAAVFNKGGSLTAIGTWSIDGGTGVDDYCAFATSEGQIALYKGTDPNAAATWALQGVYDLGTPLGKKCFLKVGGDLYYICRDGVYPLSKALQSTNTNNSIAITDNISSVFSSSATLYGNSWGWQGIVSYTDSLLLFNIPVTEFSTSVQYAMNVKTGAWCRFTDWNAYCWEIIDNQLYMGMTGKVAKGWIGLNDFGGVINCYAKGAYDYYGLRARLKKVNLVRPALKITGTVSVDMAVDVDFNSGLSYGPSVFNPLTGSLWDVALWDVGVWSDVGQTRLDWISVACPDCYNAAPRLRVISKDATVEWSATDVVFETGGIKN